MGGLKKAGIGLNRKMLSEIAISDESGFQTLVERARTALGPVQ
jgi:large subunit ribosomal protein L20